MKSAKVLKILRISRQILVQRVKNKEIQVIELPNSFYDYNDDDIYSKDSADKSYETKIFEEIIPMLYLFTMKMYSKRRKHKLKIV